MPCNLVIAYMYFQFHWMGNRFLTHFQKCDPTFRRSLGLFVITLVVIGSTIDVFFNIAYFLYPTVMSWLQLPCADEYYEFQAVQIYISVLTQPVQGLFMLFVIEFI